MTEETPFTEEKEAPFSKASNPVQALRDKLYDAFTPPASSTMSTDNNECLLTLKHFLSLTGWSQGDRRIFEAMPHVDPVDTLQSFRSILFRLGFTTKVEPVSLVSLREEFFPCFLRTEEGHLFVIEKYTDDQKLWVYDPTSTTAGAFDPESLEGTLIFPEKKEDDLSPIQRAQQRWSTELLRIFRPIMGRVFFLSLLTNFFALCPPLFVMGVYDKAIGAGSTDILLGLSIGIVMIIAADFALRQIRGQLQAYLGARLDNQVNESAFRQLLHMPLNFTENAPVGSQLTRLKQMGSIRDAFTGMLVNSVFDLPFLLLFLVVIAMIGGSLVYVPIALMVGYAVIAAWAIPTTKRLVRTAGDRKSKLHNLLVEAVSSQATIHELHAEESWLERHRKLSAQTVEANMKARQANVLVQTLSQSFVTMAGVMTLAIGVHQVIEGTLSPGALIAVMALSWRVLGPIRNIFLSGLTLGQTLQSIDQVDRLLRMNVERQPNAA
ncbi:MAG: ABC transporter transmembrane domain-containing protein, partial [Pseudomonadota bacterium]